MKPRRNPLLRTLVLSSIFISPSFADTIIKANNTSALNLAASWTTGITPTAADIATWDSTVTAANTVAIGADASWSGLSVQSPGGAVSITGTNTLTLGTAGLAHTGTAALTIAPKVSLNGSQAWSINEGTVTVTGELGGSGAISKEGNGTLFLSASNAFTGNLTLKAGNLTLGNQGALGASAGTLIIEGGTIRTEVNNSGIAVDRAKPITLAGNLTYAFGGNNNNGVLDMNSGAVTLTKTVTINSGAGLLVFRGPVSGDGFGIIKSGAGTLALLGANTYTGLTDIRTSANLRTNGPASTASTNVFLNGGLIEIGGPVEPVTKLTLGTAPGQIRFKDNANSIETSAHGGVSAQDGYRKVEFVSAADPSVPLQLVWGVPSLSVGTPHFISSPDASPAYGPSNGIFLLGTPQSAGTVDLVNDLDLSGKDRRFSIRDGSAKGMPDAVLSGRLTNGSISIQGAGVVSISNPDNTITGTTRIEGGIVRVPEIAGYLGTSNVLLAGGMIEVGPGARVDIGSGPGQVSFSPTTGGGFSVYGTQQPLGLYFNDASNPTDAIRWGAAGFLQDGMPLNLSTSSSVNTTIITNPIELGSTSRSFSTNNGIHTVDAALLGTISGSGGIITTGSGAVLLDNNANNYTGPTQLSGGALVLKSFMNGGVPSPLGASTSDGPNLIINGGGIRYIGAGDVTDRLFDFRNNATINSSGSGPLVFSNTGAHTFSSSSGTAVTRTLSISGVSPGLNEIRGSIQNAPTANNLTAISKGGTSTWSLSGNNNFTGNVSVGAGELILDYSTGNSPAGQGTTNIDNSILTLKGKTTGTTAVSLPTLRLGNGNNSVSNRLVFDSNGGDGIQLTINSLGGNTTTNNSLLTSLIDISGHPANSVTVNGIANGLTAINRVIIANATGVPLTGGRSNLILRDSTGYGFAATAAETFPTTLTRLQQSEMQPLDTSTLGDTTANYRLVYSELPDSGEPNTPRSLTRTENLVFSTLSVDTSDGPIDLKLGTKSFGNSTGNNGRGILITGAHDFRLTTETGGSGYSPFVYHYGTGVFSTNVKIPSGFSYIAGGPGVQQYTGAFDVADMKFYAAGSHLRLASTGNVAGLTIGGFWIGDGAILEVAVDTNAGLVGDFSNPVGNGGGAVRFTGNSGVSAFGGDRLFNFGGNSDLLTWGANYFITSSGNSDTDHAFLLSSDKSDSTATVANPIELNGRDRVIEVRNGTAGTDAVLSGSISGIGSGLIKRGPGTLVLGAVNTYDGVTEVAAGTLRLSHASLADDSTIRLRTGGTLDLPHGQTDIVGAITVDGVAKAPGTYSAVNLPGLITGSGKLQVGNAPTSPYELWAASLPEGKRGPGDDADDDGLLNVLEYATGSDASLPGGSIFTFAGGGFSFGRADGRTDITLVLETNTDLTSPWVEVARSSGGAAFVKNVAFPSVGISEAAAGAGIHTVNVTGMQTPPDARRFYRIQVTQP